MIFSLPDIPGPDLVSNRNLRLNTFPSGSATKGVFSIVAKLSFKVTTVDGLLEPRLERREKALGYRGEVF